MGGCIANHESTLAADALTQLENLLTQAQVDAGGGDVCETHVPPSIKTVGSNLNIKVNGGDDIVFTRHRREDISIFALNAKVDEMDAKIEAVPTVEEISTGTSCREEK